MLHHVSWIWSFNTPGPKLFSGTMFRLPTAKFHQNTGFQPSKWIQMEQFFLQHYIIIKCVRPWLQGLHHNFWALKTPLYPGPAPFGQPNPTARWGGDSFGSRRCAKDTHWPRAVGTRRCHSQLLAQRRHLLLCQQIDPVTARQRGNKWLGDPAEKHYSLSCMCIYKYMCVYIYII